MAISLFPRLAGASNKIECDNIKNTSKSLEKKLEKKINDKYDEFYKLSGLYKEHQEKQVLYYQWLDQDLNIPAEEIRRIIIAEQDQIWKDSTFGLFLNEAIKNDQEQFNKLNEDFEKKNCKRYSRFE